MDPKTCACSATTFVPGSCSGSFDFTLLFEQAILEIAPACLFLIASLWRFRSTWKSPIKTIPCRMYMFKLVRPYQPILGQPNSHDISQSAITVLAVLQLTLLILWNTHACGRTATSTVAAVLALVIALVLIPLSHAEHSRSVRPSTLICVYLVASTVFDAVQTRTLFITSEDIAIPATLCCSMTAKLIITVLEAREKRAYLRQPFSSYPPETIANTFNRTFLWWLNRTFATGFRKLMTRDDLDSTSSELRSRVLARRLKLSWKSRCTMGSQAMPPSRWMLPLASFACFRSEILSVVPARLFLIGFNYAQPFLFARAIKLLAEPTNVMTENYGYGLITATGIIYIGVAVSSRICLKVHKLTHFKLATVRYQQSMFKTLTMFRGAMVSLVFDHSIALSDHMNADNAAISHISTGKLPIDESTTYTKPRRRH
jgi:ATP-binding cassette subfamily C (CFTR/MRP) protein 1